MAAPAKINLSLRILRKRPDGFHEIETVFQEIDLTDRLEFHDASDWSLEIRGAELDSGPENLVRRAAALLAATAGVPCTGRVVLTKRIPIGGGLGGGSSDAAVALMGLNRLWKLDWPVERLHTLAAQIGSDCAFFLHGGLAVGRGRGEVLELLEGALDQDIVLVVSPFGVSTAWAYSEVQVPLTDDEKSVILQFYLKAYPDPLPARKSFRNDLENIVLSRFGELSRIRQRLLDLGADVSLLSGSGSTILGIFQERARALHAAQQFESPLQVVICRAVKRPRVP
ncbi:MAG TPA: 4-(cytidine 5'-diphospho)-2-C-methyl-D-erythritol kinase [bacterium]